jgi:hypothetical protein
VGGGLEMDELRVWVQLVKTANAAFEFMVIFDHSN